MYSNRLLTAFIVGAFVFSPIIMEWSIIEATSWYQPYLFWAWFIALSVWVARSEDIDGN